MIHILKQKWSLMALLSVTIHRANVQIVFPFLPMPPPPPILFPVPIPVHPLPPPTIRSTTTTTTERYQPNLPPIAIPFPPPAIPFQFAFPAFPAFPPTCQRQPRPDSCPPCPPCVCAPACTPAFFSFCSSCHQKCRCRNSNDTPTPRPPRPPTNMIQGYAMPVPMGPPPPVIVVPMPPPIPAVPYKWRRKPNRKDDSSDDSSTDKDSSDECDGSSCDNSDSRRRRFKKRYHKKIHVFRRNANDEQLQPVLSYVGKNGEVKYKTKINHHQAASLMRNKGRDDANSNFERMLSEESVNSNSGVIMVSNGDEKSSDKKPKILLRSSEMNHILDNDVKDIVLKPPKNKKISNLTLSFQFS